MATGQSLNSCRLHEKKSSAKKLMPERYLLKNVHAWLPR